jgi:hypothetical protein
VQACLRGAERHGIDPFLIARELVKRDPSLPCWTREQWEAARDAYDSAELERRAATFRID